jgi:hypothetical protein
VFAIVNYKYAKNPPFVACTSCKQKFENTVTEMASNSVEAKRPALTRPLSEEQELFEALLDEEYKAAKTEVDTARSPRALPLTARLGDSMLARSTRMLVLIQAQQKMIKDCERIWEELAEVHQGLVMERQMFAKMRAAGISGDSWLLQPIMMDLADRHMIHQRDNFCMQSRAELAASMWRDTVVELKKLEVQLEQGEKAEKESEGANREKE